MNTSVLFRDLLELVDGSDKGSVSVFAKTLREHYVGAVDIQVLSPEGEIIMHQPENKLHGNRSQKYLTLLADAVKGEAVNLLSVNREKSSAAKGEVTNLASEKREELMEVVKPNTH